MDNLKSEEKIYIVQGPFCPAIMMMVGFGLTHDSLRELGCEECVQPTDLLDPLSIFRKDQMLKGQSM